MSGLYRSSGRTVVLALALVLALPSDPAVAAEGCAGLFPDVSFSMSKSAGPVMVYGTKFDQPLFDRFVADVEASSVAVHDDLGGLVGVEVCLFPGNVEMDPTGLVPEGQQLHAVAFHEANVIALGARQFASVKRAAAFGLASMALWNINDGPHAEPLSTTIAQWYSARVQGRELTNHNSMLFSNLVSRNEEWPLAVASQTATRAWNPQFQDSAASDLIAYAVATRGPEVMAETSDLTWREIGTEWSEALRTELRPDGPGTTHLWGAAIFFGIILLAIVTAFIRWKAKHVKRRPEEWVDVLPTPVTTGLETYDR
ncbi:MAG: hypothetical protein HKN07_08370 [Acidimicrobiia bacterium]|nr:hypothetical protein [Acidimicrobiia bacterium]